MICGHLYYSFMFGKISANLQSDGIVRGSYEDKLSDINKFFKLYEINEVIVKQVSC